MASKLMNTRKVGNDQYAEYFLESVTDLSDPQNNIPQRPTKNVCLGSVAYTMQPFMLYNLTNNGSMDKNGMVVSI